tara:strand:- start:2453 stop:3901 length:1449 start_codon:yes stop_codon:yes gene_type:complete
MGNTFKLPDVILNNLKNESNTDENIFCVFNYVQKHINNDDELEQLYLAIIEFKPNAHLVGQYAWELFKKNRTAVAVSLLENKEKYSGDDYDWEVFKSSEKDILQRPIENSIKSEVEILIYGPGIKILYGCMDPETYKALEEHSDGSLEDILCDSDKLYELTKEKYLSMYELDNSQTWQGADLDAFIKIIVNNEVIVNDRFDEVFDLNKVLDYSQRANSDFGHQNYIRFTKKPAAQTTIIGNSNIKGEILKCKFETEEAFDIENLTFLILDAEDEGYSKFVEEIFYKGKFINHEGNSSYDEQGWTFNVSKPKIQDEDNQSQKTNLTISFDFDDASEKGNLTELIEKFELKYDKMIETINFLDNQFGMSQKSRYLDNMTKCKNIISTYLKSDYVNEKVVSEEWDKDFLSLITYDRTDHITITGIEDFEDHDETLKFKNIEVNAGIIELDEDLLAISEDFYIEATDEGNDLYSSYYGGEHDSGDL